MHYVRVFLNKLPEDLIPYKTLTTRAFFHVRSGSNYEPNVVRIFSDQGAVKYALLMSDVWTSMSLNFVRIRAMRKLSCETIPIYVNVEGATVACPPATYQAFLSEIFHIDIKDHMKSDILIGRRGILPFRQLV